MKNKGLYTPDCIRTKSGIYVNVINPTPDMIVIEDIAHSLSNLCRFGGHTQSFYSVAQHSVLCADLVKGKENKLTALLHDASEAYLIDVPSPLKKHLPDYQKIEKNMMKVISKKFGIKYPFSKDIKKADEKMLKVEWDCMMVSDLNSDIFSWSPDIANMKFMMMFRKLTKRL